MASEVNGSVVLLRIDGQVLAGQLDSSISMSMDTEPVIVSGGRLREFIATKFNSSLQITLIYNSLAMTTLFNAFKNGQQVSVSFADETSAHGGAFTCSAIITEITSGHPRNGLATISLTIKVVGNLNFTYS